MKWYSAIVCAIGIAFSVALALYPKAGHRTWKPEYAQNAPEVKKWDVRFGDFSVGINGGQLIPASRRAECDPHRMPHGYCSTRS
jgi:hypothetical protein